MGLTDLDFWQTKVKQAANTDYSQYVPVQINVAALWTSLATNYTYYRLKTTEQSPQRRGEKIILAPHPLIG